MALKAKHAFGKSENLETALNLGTIDNYDILFLDGETEPKIGWVDGSGVIRLVQDKVQIVRVDELPIADGDENVVYIFNNEGYIWDSVNGECIPLAQSTDLTELATQVSGLETQMEMKVDAETVQQMINTTIESSNEIIEF